MLRRLLARWLRPRSVSKYILAVELDTILCTGYYVLSEYRNGVWHVLDSGSCQAGVLIPIPPHIPINRLEVLYELCP